MAAGGVRALQSTLTTMEPGGDAAQPRAAGWVAASWLLAWVGAGPVDPADPVARTATSQPHPCMAR
jgi:hypothetical protein